MKVLVLHTSTHDPKESSSAALARAAVQRIGEMTPISVKFIDASKLHIVENLSCYANGKSHCADPKAGPYRCWAHVSSLEDPKKYGGIDQMPVIYDGLKWADTVVFTSSTRWGSRSALAQKVIERMNTLENRAVAYGEPYPMKGKRLGVVFTGVDWRTEQAVKDTITTLRWWGFATTPDFSCGLWWQRSMDPYFEQPDNNKPYLERWTLTQQGRAAINYFSSSLLSDNVRTFV